MLQSGSSVGGIVGGVLGGLALITALIFGFVYLRRRRRAHTSPMVQVVSPWVLPPKEAPFGVTREQSEALQLAQTKTAPLRHVETLARTRSGEPLDIHSNANAIARPTAQTTSKRGKFCNFMNTR